MPRVPVCIRGCSQIGGFTLIEVMIVVVVLGVLLMVALPSYQESLQKGRRSDAIGALMEVANRQEQFMLDRNAYTGDMTALGYPADPMLSSEGHYTVDATACTGGTFAVCYLLTAVPVASSPQALDTRCTSFTLDSFGNRGATGSAPASCW